MTADYNMTAARQAERLLVTSLEWKFCQSTPAGVTGYPPAGARKPPRWSEFL